MDNRKKALILNPPSSDNSYINRDQMGGMGQKMDFGRDFKSKFLSRLKSNFIHLPVVQLVYAATMLVENGFDVKVIDALNEGIGFDEVMARAQKFQPDFIVMEVSSSCLLFERDTVAKKLKELCPNALIITTGDTITHDVEQFKEPFDISIFGEVERVILDICKAEKPLTEISGIIYRKNGEIVRNAEKKSLSNEELDKLPFPRWDLFKIDNFVYYPLLSKKPVAVIQSTRGCPYGCGYCSYPVNQGLKWRSRSAKNVVDEMEKDAKVYGFKGVFFRDPLFTLDKQRIEDMCAIIKERGLKLEFCFETRPELLTKELIEKLHDAGCRAINFGVEDIHPEILTKILRKPIDIAKVEETIGHCERVGIRATCFFILGLPGSTRKSIAETIAFSKKLNPSHADYKIATPFPGTHLYKMAKENKWIKKEGWNLIGGYSATMQMSDELSPEYLENVCQNAFSNFYLRPGYVWRELKRGYAFKMAKMVVTSL